VSGRLEVSRVLLEVLHLSSCDASYYLPIFIIQLAIKMAEREEGREQEERAHTALFQFY